MNPVVDTDKGAFLFPDSTRCRALLLVRDRQSISLMYKWRLCQKISTGSGNYYDDISIQIQMWREILDRRETSRWRVYLSLVFLARPIVEP
jgi:hypothetical protein